jgi:hypothetical protein
MLTLVGFLCFTVCADPFSSSSYEEHQSDVWFSEVDDLFDSLSSIQNLGEALDTIRDFVGAQDNGEPLEGDQARTLVAAVIWEIDARLSQLPAVSAQAVLMELGFPGEWLNRTLHRYRWPRVDQYFHDRESDQLWRRLWALRYFYYRRLESKLHSSGVWNASAFQNVYAFEEGGSESVELHHIPPETLMSLLRACMRGRLR